MDVSKYTNSASYTPIGEGQPLPIARSSEASSSLFTFKTQNQRETRRGINTVLKSSIATAEQHGEESTDEESLPSHEGTPLLSGKRVKTYGGGEGETLATSHKDRAWENFISKQEVLKGKEITDIKGWSSAQKGLSLSEVSAWFFNQK